MKKISKDIKRQQLTFVSDLKKDDALAPTFRSVGTSRSPYFKLFRKERQFLSILENTPVSGPALNRKEYKHLYFINRYILPRLRKTLGVYSYDNSRVYGQQYFLSKQFELYRAYKRVLDEYEPRILGSSPSRRSPDTTSNAVSAKLPKKYLGTQAKALSSTRVSMI